MKIKADYPPKNDDNYVDSHLEDLRTKEGAEDIDKKLNNDREIENYVDPHLQQLRDNEKERLVKEKQEELRQVLEKEAFPSKGNIIWEKPAPEEPEVDMDTFLGTKKIEETADTQPVVEESVQKKGWFGSLVESGKNFLYKTKKPAAVTLGAIAMSMPAAAATPNTTAEKIFSDSTLKKEAPAADTITAQNTKKNTIAFYTSSKTAEGAITPTGFNNSFFNNEFGITESDVISIAEKYGFRTDNEANFQKDVVEYVQKNNPEEITRVLKKYGPTNYAEENNIAPDDYKGLLDKNLGVRLADVLNTMKTTPPEVTDSVPEEPQIDGGDNNFEGSTNQDKIFNTNGYDKLVILFDVSPSMQQHKATLANELKSNTSDLPVEVVGFTNKIDTSMTVANPAAASEVLKDIQLIDQDSELALDVLLEKLESSQNTQEKTLIVVSTDEALQGLTQEKLTKLKSLSKEKGADIQFTVLIGKQIHNLTLTDVQERFTDKYEKVNAPELAQMTKGVEIRNKIIEDIKKSNGSQKEIDENEEEIKSIQERMSRWEQVTLSDFSPIENKKDIASN